MRIIQLTPGSGGGFYCENCLRDLGLTRALRALGLDVLLTPLYLPLGADAPAERGPLFFGAIRVFLQEKSALFRRLPGWAQRLLDAPGLLGLAGRRAGPTSPAGLEEMTLSMLRGEEGRQAAEVERLAGWLAGQERPLVVHLSNALLLGVARRIGRDLGIPIVCSLQDEGSWVDPMPPKSARTVWEAMAAQAVHVSAFVAVSRTCRDRMIPRLGLDPGRVSVIPIGIDTGVYPAAPLPGDPPVLGFLSRLGEAQGLGRLADAFLELRRDPRLAGLRLHACGGSTPADAPFLRGLRRRLEGAGAWQAVSLFPGLDLPQRIRFLQGLSVLSVPMDQGEDFGLFLLEAQASGVPVVQPRAGAFPEVLAATEGGVLYEPGRPGALEEALSALLTDPARAARLGAAGRARAAERFDLAAVAARTAALYRSVAEGGPGGRVDATGS